MIGGVHTIIYSKNADAVRTFLKDVLEFESVDAGHGWLIFAAPPGELAVHPNEGKGYHELYLMCRDIHAAVEKLEKRGVEFTMPIANRGWGLLTQIKLPDGESLGLYTQAQNGDQDEGNPDKRQDGKWRNGKAEDCEAEDIKVGEAEQECEGKTVRSKLHSRRYKISTRLGQAHDKSSPRMHEAELLSGRVIGHAAT